MAALKKQQADLAAKLDAAELRATTAEAALAQSQVGERGPDNNKNQNEDLSKVSYQTGPRGRH